MRVRKLTIAWSFVLIFICVSPALAQSDRGGLTGRVVDSNGAVVAGAKVIVLNVATGETREARTSDEGNYTIPQLPAVVYTLKIEA